MTLTLRALVDQRPELPAAVVQQQLRSPPPKAVGHQHRLPVKMSAEEAAGLHWWRSQSHRKRRCMALLLLNLAAGMAVEEAARGYREGMA